MTKTGSFPGGAYSDLPTPIGFFEVSGKQKLEMWSRYPTQVAIDVVRMTFAFNGREEGVENPLRFYVKGVECKPTRCDGAIGVDTPRMRVLPGERIGPITVENIAPNRIIFIPCFIYEPLEPFRNQKEQAEHMRRLMAIRKDLLSSEENGVFYNVDEQKS